MIINSVRTIILSIFFNVFKRWVTLQKWVCSFSFFKKKMSVNYKGPHQICNVTSWATTSQTLEERWAHMKCQQFSNKVYIIVPTDKSRLKGAELELCLFCILRPQHNVPISAFRFKGLCKSNIWIRHVIYYFIKQSH